MPDLVEVVAAHVGNGLASSSVYVQSAGKMQRPVVWAPCQDLLKVTVTTC